MENETKKKRIVDAKNRPKSETVIDFMLFRQWRKNEQLDAEIVPKMSVKSSKR